MMYATNLAGKSLVTISLPTRNLIHHYVFGFLQSLTQYVIADMTMSLPRTLFYLVALLGNTNADVDVRFLVFMVALRSASKMPIIDP